MLKKWVLHKKKTVRGTIPSCDKEGQKKRKGDERKEGWAGIYGGQKGTACRQLIKHKKKKKSRKGKDVAHSRKRDIRTAGQ